MKEKSILLHKKLMSFILCGIFISHTLSACQAPGSQKTDKDQNTPAQSINSIELEAPKELTINIGEEIRETHIGNSTGNISNSSSVAYYDGWVYVTFGKIFKMRPDGSEKTIISNMKGSCINVTEQGIFFIDRSGGYRGSTYFIYRMNHDGTNIQQLNRLFSHNLNVIKDWVYYTADPSGTPGPDHFIYRMKTDGSNQEQLTDEYAKNMIVVDDWIYYANVSEGHTIWKMRLDGSEKKAFFGYAMSLSARSIIYSDHWIYCINRNDGILYRISLDGEQIEAVINHQEAYVYNIQGEWIYYTVFGNEDGPAIFGYRIDSKEIHFIKKPSDALHYNLYRIEKMEERILCHQQGDFLSIAGGYLYFEGGQMARNRELHRVPLIGGEVEHLDSDHT